MYCKYRPSQLCQQFWSPPHVSTKGETINHRPVTSDILYERIATIFQPQQVVALLADSYYNIQSENKNTP
jgi:hypothetical protein